MTLRSMFFTGLMAAIGAASLSAPTDGLAQTRALTEAECKAVRERLAAMRTSPTGSSGPSKPDQGSSRDAATDGGRSADTSWRAGRGYPRPAGEDPGGAPAAGRYPPSLFVAFLTLVAPPNSSGKSMRWTPRRPIWRMSWPDCRRGRRAPLGPGRSGQAPLRLGRRSYPLPGRTGGARRSRENPPA